MNFTENQYQKIINGFDEISSKYNLGFMNHNVVKKFQEFIYEEFGTVFYLSDEWPKIVALANPETREQAHEQYVLKEEKFIWRSKRRDKDGDPIILSKNSFGSVISDNDEFNNCIYREQSRFHITESEANDWGYTTEFYNTELVNEQNN